MPPLPTAPRSAPVPVLVPAQRSREREGAGQAPSQPVPVRERPRRRERRGRGAAVVAVLAAALVLSLGAAAHLWVVSDAWKERAEAGEAQRSQLVSTSEQLQQRLDALQADLAASDARVEQLAAEKARATDLREAADR